MDRQTVLELVGYAASILVAVSLMMRSILRLRVINLVGSVAFTVYGVLIHAYPVAAVNFLIVLINLHFLRQMLGAREYFRLLEVRPDSEYLLSFLDFHRAEIQRFLPGFSHAPSDHTAVFVVLRDMIPAGVFIGTRAADGVLRVELDFVIAQYRDFKTGRYLFREQAEFFRARGIRRIVSPGGDARHAAYLRRMGFAPEPVSAGEPLYRLDVG